jgi:1-phosphatidylinositol-3-phosphate 5-kinase
VLTEFARDFEQDSSETVITKLKNKIYEACNNVNADIGPSTSTTQVTQDQNVSEPINNEEESQQSISETSSSVSISVSSNSEQNDSKKADDGKVYQVDASQGRTSLNVIKRISNLIMMKDKNLNDYKNTELQKLWMPDEKSRECYDCQGKFTVLRRKHHCRLCGCIFCSKCCSQIIPGKIINCSGDLRVCTYCSKVVLSYIQSPDINADLRSDLQALEEDLSNKFVKSNSNSSQPSPSEMSPHRKVRKLY